MQKDFFFFSTQTLHSIYKNKNILNFIVPKFYSFVINKKKKFFFLDNFFFQSSFSLARIKKIFTNKIIPGRALICNLKYFNGKKLSFFSLNFKLHIKKYNTLNILNNKILLYIKKFFILKRIRNGFILLNQGIIGFMYQFIWLQYKPLQSLLSQNIFNIKFLFLREKKKRIQIKLKKNKKWLKWKHHKKKIFNKKYNFFFSILYFFFWKSKKDN